MTAHSYIASTINSVVNQSDAQGASSRVLQAIKYAADKTGVDFSYLVKKASQESGFDPTAKASNSTATGLYQFTSQTWLQMVKTYGAQYGLGHYATQISANSDGHLSVSDPAVRKEILALRNDPTVSAEMAGEFDKENAASLKDSVGGKIGNTELYLAHFLGAGGASDFISEMRSNPSASAAAVLPSAAAANPSVFYAKDGQPRSLQQIYEHFAQKFNVPLQASTTQIASTATTSSVKMPVGADTSLKASTSASTPSNSGTSVAALALSNKSLVPRANTLYSTTADATPTASGLRATLGAGGVNLSGSSTLFATMVLAQIGHNGGSNLGANDRDQSDGKKHNALSVLSGVA